MAWPRKTVFTTSTDTDHRKLKSVLSTCDGDGPSDK